MDVRGLLTGGFNAARRLLPGARSAASPVSPASTPDGPSGPTEPEQPPKHLPDPADPVQSNYLPGRAKLKHEYASGDPNFILGSYLRVLPQYIDARTQAFGDDLYESMMLDDQVSSSVYAFTSMILAEDVHLRPAIDNKTDPDYRLSKQITEFCEHCLDNLSRSLDETLEEMALAVVLGNQVAEQVYEPMEDGAAGARFGVPGGASPMALRALKVKPRRTTGFVVDAYRNVVGLRAIIPGKSLAVSVGSMVIDPAVLSNVISRQKFAVLTWRGRKGDPRGTSIGSAAYDPWWEKHQVAADYMRYLQEFASPSLLGILAENAIPEQPTDGSGNVLPGAAPINPTQAMLNMILSWRNGTGGVVPYGADIKTVFASGTGEAFIRKLEYCDNRIARAVLLSTRMTQEAQHGSKADSETSQDVTGNQVKFGKKVVGRMLTADVLKNLVLYNYGKDAADRLCPRATLSPIDHQDWPDVAAAAGSLVTSGLVTEPMKAALCEKIGLPPYQAAPAAAPGAMPPGAPGQQPPPEAAGNPPQSSPGAPPGRTPAPAPSPPAPAVPAAAGDPDEAALQQMLASFSRDDEDAFFRFALFAGLNDETGNLKDKLGRRMCFRDGQRVPCPAKEDKGKEPSPAEPVPAGSLAPGKASVETIHAHVKGLLDNPDKITPETAGKLIDVLTGKLTVAEIHELKRRFGLKASGNKSELAKKVAQRILAGAAASGLAAAPQPEPKERSNDSASTELARPERPGEGAGAGSERPAGAPPEAGQPVEAAPGGPADTGANQGRDAASEPARDRAASRVPATLGEVNGKIDRFEKYFRAKGQHGVADWMGTLRNHVNTVSGEDGLKALMESLGEEKSGAGEDAQYPAWESMDEFTKHYLDRNGVSVVGAAADPGKKLFSNVAASSDAEGVQGRGRESDFLPSLPTLKDKLAEAQHLPGLEKSEDVGKLMGGKFGSKVENFSPRMLAKLDETYGQGKWIVKSYGDEAYAGYGIFFPQRVAQIQQDARNTIWSAGEQVAKHGFTLNRDEAGKVTGLKHAGGDVYDFQGPLSRVMDSRPNVGGQEHEVFEDVANNRFLKLTKGGHFGQNKDLSEYLERHRISNELWPELGYKFHGVTEDAEGRPQAVMSMNKIDGPVPSQNEVHQWFDKHGWVPVKEEDSGFRDWGPEEEKEGNLVQSWRDPKTGTVVNDAHANNFIKTGKDIVPIDVDVIPGKDAQAAKEPSEAHVEAARKAAQKDASSPEAGRDPGSFVSDLRKHGVVDLPESGSEAGRWAQPGDVQAKYNREVLETAKKSGDYIPPSKYDRTIHGDVRKWADAARQAAPDEHGAALPPGSFMAQPAFAAVGVSDADRAAGKTIAPGEGRVHIVTRNGKAEIIPHATWIKNEWLPVVFESDDTRAMAKAAQEAISALPESERQGQLYAPDILKTADGYRVVEANPSNEAGSSGYLENNPLVIDSYVSHLTGREPAHVRFVRKLLSSRKGVGKS